MSKPYANAAWPFRLAVSAAVALTLAGCGSSTPRQADTAPPREAALPPVTVATAEPTVEPEQEQRRERRGERRAVERVSEELLAAASTEPVPEAAAAAHARALAAMRSENWLEAELELEQLSLEYPVYPGPYVNLALVYLKGGRRDDARDALERALALDPGHAAANTQLGILLREDGEFAAAEAAYRRALDANPDHGLAHYNLGVLLDLYLRRTAEALEHYEAYQASLAEPNETVARWIVDLRRRVGNANSARVAQEDGR